MSDGTGRIYKRWSVYWIDYSYRGERHRESSKSTKRRVAKALLEKRMAEMAAGGPMVDEEAVTLADLRKAVEDDYVANGKRSLDRVQLAFDHLEAYYGKGRRAVDLTTDRVKSYVAARKGEKAANASINKELAALRRGFNLLLQAGRLSRAPHISGLETHNVRQGFLTAGDIEAICAELSADLAPVVRFAFLTGWRKREVLTLQWRQVDWTAGTIRLEPGTTKNRQARTFPFAALPSLRELLERQRERTRAAERERGGLVPWVFHRKGEEIRDMRGAWQGATKRAGLSGMLFHDLRRSAVRNFERAGISRSVAMSFSGHKTESVYRRYSIVDRKAQEEGAAKLAALHQEDAKVRPIRKAEGA